MPIPMDHMEPPKGKIVLKGTLILVTSTLVRQWATQCNLFLGDKYKVLAIPSMVRLRRVKFPEYLKADIIIAPWNILVNEKYLDRFSRFVALPTPSTSDGRQLFTPSRALIIGFTREFIRAPGGERVDWGWRQR